MNQTDITALQRAIQAAWRSREHGNHPFRAVLADAAGPVILEAENTVKPSATVWATRRRTWCARRIASSARAA
jgi:tRNA(Arg) A34 adenosine deaminase TadA